MSRDWTPDELQAASAAMKAAGHMRYEEFCEELKKQEGGIKLMKRLYPEIGRTYTNHNGNDYICRAIPEYGCAVMERLKDNWVLVAHGICQYDDGTIEWDYSTGGHWIRPEE